MPQIEFNIVRFVLIVTPFFCSVLWNVPLWGLQEMAMLLERGSLCRTTGSTLMNAHSSRSHAIFTVLLEQRIRPEGEAAVADEKVIVFFSSINK